MAERLCACRVHALSLPLGHLTLTEVLSENGLDGPLSPPIAPLEMFSDCSPSLWGVDFINISMGHVGTQKLFRVPCSLFFVCCFYL